MNNKGKFMNINNSNLNHDILLNNKWKQYFNWTLIYPAFFIIGYILLIAMIIVSNWNSLNAPDGLIVALGSSLTLILIFPILFIGYSIWFFFASDKLFQLLYMDRKLSNIFNIGSFLLLPGLSMLVTPIILWIKIKDYWNERGTISSWRGVLK